MKRSRWVRHLAALTALALVVAACGDDDGDGDTDTTEETEVEEPEAEEEPEADDTETEEETEEPADDEEAADVERPERDDVLDIGYILPETGDLAFLGAPQIEAVRLAIDDINAAGGVLGNDVTLTTGDEAGDAAVVRDSAISHINAGVDAIVGAAASGMSQEFIQLTHDNQIVQCSAANTSPSFTEQDNNAYYFRTVPPDEAVAPIIANEVIGDGYVNVAVLARADDYGNALRELVVAELEGQVEIALTETYNPDSDDFDALVTQVTGAGADAVVVIGFGEAATLFLQLIEGGVPADALYGGDGVFGPTLPDEVGTNIDGLKVIGAAGGEEFNERLNERLDDNNQGNLIYGGQAYDCAIVVALAAVASGSVDPAVFNDEVENVTRDGEECTSFEDCVALLEEGTDIDYVGASGPIQLQRPDPTFGRYAVGQFQNDGELVIVGDQDVDLGAM